MKKLFLVLALALPMMAAAQKIGHVNSSEIIAAMPELAEAQKSLEAKEAEYKTEVEQMQQELQTRYQAFQEKANMLGEAARNKELMELQDLDSRVQKFVEFSRQALQEEQQKLMQPIQEKVMKAIETEAKAKGLSYVLDQQAMLYVGKDAVDLTPAVKKALGLK
ncbi:MAG: OmpH family outer membrane protein [Paludibacteraceae bacterium]|jgi:outer membrane protein|nr:OmpH family outer membrane protein [Paludibacteraceae bacterium]